MYYLALYADESAAGEEASSGEGGPGPRHRTFWSRAQEPVAGAALGPNREAATVRHDDGRAYVSDGPAEESGSVDGYYVFDAADLDAVLSLVRQIPEAATGRVELWPMVDWSQPNGSTDARWAALLRQPRDAANAPEFTEQEQITSEHHRFGDLAGDRLVGSGGVYPPESVTTVRLRGGEMLLDDGPPDDARAVVNGVYVFSEPDRDAVIDLAARIPVGPEGWVEVRQIATG